MKYIEIGKDRIKASAIALGCMRISSMDNSQVEELLMTALEQGVNFFDHADIYGKGKSEELFGEFMANHKNLREKMIIQTKCAIRPGYYDFSKEHIIKSVETSLKRMNLDYIDVLLLHRPDALMEPEEVGEAFEAWKKKKPDLGEELADVAIYLLGLAEILDVDLGQEVRRKMDINRRRRYGVVDGVWQRLEDGSPGEHT